MCYLLYFEEVKRLCHFIFLLRINVIEASFFMLFFQIDSFGHFKVWHAGGSLLVAVSFSSVFGGCMACALLGGNVAVVQTIGYSTFAAIFNVGWAATQVSHM